MGEETKTTTMEKPGEKKTTEETHKPAQPERETKKTTVEHPNPSQK